MSLRLSKKYGLNPSIVTCPICSKSMGIALLGANRGNKAPMTMKGDELCDDCKKKYITIVEVIPSGKKYKATGRRAFVSRDTMTHECKEDIALMLSEEFIKLNLIEK